MTLTKNKLIAIFFIFTFGIFYNKEIIDLTVPSLTDVRKIAHKVDAKQIACLAKNIYYEAGSETLQGQAAVARVVMNRIKYGFASNPCQVVYQAHHIDKVDSDGDKIKVKLCQFSWVCEENKELNKNSHRYKQAEQVAYDVLVHDAYKTVVPKNALFFHNLEVDPYWPYKQVAKIGNHIFYSKEKKPNESK